MKKRRDLMRESVAGAPDFAYSQLQRALPRYVDDAERDFGVEIYDRMLRDPMIAAAIDTLKVRALQDGLRIFGDDSPAERKICDFVRDQFDGLDTAIEETLFDLLDGLAHGHKLAEVVLKEIPGGIGVKSIKPKPRNNYRFVVDAFENLIGIAAVVPGESMSVPEGIVTDQSGAPVLPLEKFLILRFGSKNGDPRGVSLLRAAYNPWWLKQQTWPQMLKFLSQFAGPSLIGYTPENSAMLGTDGGQTPEEVMLNALRQFQNGSIVVLRGGAKVEAIQSPGEGQAFLSAIELYNREITHAILKQTRATMEAQHGSRADSETGEGILENLVTWIQGCVERAVRNQIVRPLVRMNFGMDAPVPRLSLRAPGKPGFVGAAEAVAKLASSGYLDESQKHELDILLGLPNRQSGTDRRKR